MSAKLTLSNTESCSLFKPLNVDVNTDDWVIFTVVDFSSKEREGVLLSWGERKILFPSIDKNKWNLLKEICRAQQQFWLFDKYHRERCRINLLYHTITLANLPRILVDVLNPSNSVACDRRWATVNGTTKHEKYFSISFPQGYLISKRTYVIINNVYRFRSALYQATCIEYVGFN